MARRACPERSRRGHIPNLVTARMPAGDPDIGLRPMVDTTSTATNGAGVGPVEPFRTALVQGETRPRIVERQTRRARFQQERDLPFDKGAQLLEPLIGAIEFQQSLALPCVQREA